MSSAIKTEIINLENEALTCQDLGNYPLQTNGGVGSNIGSFTAICGGLGTGAMAGLLNQCYKLVAGAWQQFATMSSKRGYAAGMIVGNSLMMFGGFGDDGRLQSTEIINENGQVSQGPNMPTGLVYHAIATVNTSTLIISGGTNEVYSDDSPLTWYFNHVTQKFQEGPSLMESRSRHASGTVVDHVTNENIVVVAGGERDFDYGPFDYLDSTELLINGEWQQGENHGNNKNVFCLLLLCRCAFFSNIKSLLIITFLFCYISYIERIRENGDKVKIMTYDRMFLFL